MGDGTGADISPKEWGDIFYRARHSAHNISSIESATKITTYWYLTPPRLHRYDHSRSPGCWRGCVVEGTLLHPLWECPTLTQYWEQTLDEINKHLVLQYCASRCKSSWALLTGLHSPSSLVSVGRWELLWGQHYKIYCPTGARTELPRYRGGCTGCGTCLVWSASLSHSRAMRPPLLICGIPL